MRGREGRADGRREGAKGTKATKGCEGVLSLAIVAANEASASSFISA